MSALRTIVERVIPGGDPALDKDADAFFHALSVFRRRFVIREAAAKQTVTLSALANDLAVEESPAASTAADITERERKRCYVSLYQTHLPRLDETGLIDYDGDENEVRATRETATAADILDEMETAMAERPLPKPHDPEAEVEAVGMDDVFTLLKNERRRHVISLLADVEAGRRVTLDWLATNVAEIETGHPEGGVTSKERKRPYTALYQSHLPRFTAKGFVHWVGRGPITVTDRIAWLHHVMLVGEARLNGGAA